MNSLGTGANGYLVIKGESGRESNTKRRRVVKLLILVVVLSFRSGDISEESRETEIDKGLYHFLSADLSLVRCSQRTSDN